MQRHPWIMLLGLLALKSFHSVAAQGSGAIPLLPPGISLLDNETFGEAPLGYEVAGLGVDWTNPLLHAELDANSMYQLDRVDAEGNPDLAPSWGSIELRNPGILRMQLLEPVESIEDVLKFPALDMRAGDDNAEARVAFWKAQCAPHALVRLPGRPAPFVPQPAEEDALWKANALTDSDDERAAVRWLGRLHDISRLTGFEFRDRALISLSNPTDCTTKFMLVRRIDAKLGRLEDLKKWISQWGRPMDWLAVHSLGPQAITGIDGWRLGGAGDTRREERLGVSLNLRSRSAGESIDWARLPGVKVLASSFEAEYPPNSILSGKVWPNPFAPTIWQSRAVKSNESAWVELEFATPRPIERIIVLDADAAGWSLAVESAPRLSVDGTEPIPADSTTESQPRGRHQWRIQGSDAVQRIRIDFEAPDSGRQPDGRARLLAIQAWGPWDGTTGVSR